jgi:hypothetical protein
VRSVARDILSLVTHLALYIGGAAILAIAGAIGLALLSGAQIYPLTAESRQRARYRETMLRMYQNRAVVELYFREHGKYPLAAQKALLGDLGSEVARGARKLAAIDGWQHPIRYWSSADQQHYFMISPGANGEVEYQLGAPAPPSTGSGQDLVMHDGAFFYYWDGWTYCPMSCRTTESAYLECEARGERGCVDYLSKSCDRYDPPSSERTPAW